jgi:hypothetical protein
MWAQSPGGPLFARHLLDPADRAVLDHEARVRTIVGQDGPLRAPPILARGPSWSVEAGIEREPWEGSDAMDLLVEAGRRVMGLRLPTGPVRRRGERRLHALARRARSIRSPLPLADMARARAIVRSSRLPRRTGHGDFQPNNVLLSDGAVWVLDWELCGPLPAGTDLLRMSLHLSRREDREHVFRATVDVVGEAHRADLARLQYALAVQVISSKLGLATGIDRDPAAAARLLSLLPELRRAALR